MVSREKRTTSRRSSKRASALARRRRDGRGRLGAGCCCPARTVCSGVARNHACTHGGLCSSSDTTKPLRHAAHGTTMASQLKEARLDHGRQHARAIGEEERDLREDPDDHEGAAAEAALLLRSQWSRWARRVPPCGNQRPRRFAGDQTLRATLIFPRDEPRVEVPRTSPS